MLNEQMKQFKEPGADFRGMPFWAWNAGLEPGELIRQIRVMKEMGLGGFFMHARVGLNTKYLGPEWFECVRTCVAEAEKLGMKAWLYDEDRFPSGAAGGLVTRDPAFRARHLLLTSSRIPSPLSAITVICSPSLLKSEMVTEPFWVCCMAFARILVTTCVNLA